MRINEIINEDKWDDKLWAATDTQRMMHQDHELDLFDKEQEFKDSNTDDFGNNLQHPEYWDQSNYDQRVDTRNAELDRLEFDDTTEN
jgi:hypothetical protein